MLLCYEIWIVGLLAAVSRAEAGTPPKYITRREKALAEELHVAVPEFLAKVHVYLTMLDNCNDKSGVGM